MQRDNDGLKRDVDRLKHDNSSALPTPLTSRGLLAAKHVAQQAHAPFIGAACQICTQLPGFSRYDPLNEDPRASVAPDSPGR